MSRPGIVLAYGGLYIAMKRLENAMDIHHTKSNGATEADVVRSLCESLFWLFALNEDFKALVENKTSDKIYSWWSKQGITGRQMNALRFIRNRITHSHLHYWELVDHNTLEWIHASPPTTPELAGPAGTRA